MTFVIVVVVCAIVILPNVTDNDIPRIKLDYLNGFEINYINFEA